MEIMRYGNPSADTVLIQPIDQHDLDAMDTEVEWIRKSSTREFCLIAYRITDWGHDLSPWKAPAVFGREDFGDGAADTLSRILAYCDDPSKTFFLGGYSLAGLFALWAACRTDVFRGIAAASPSVWFPGFTDFLKAQKVQSTHVYLSLGDREEKTRNPVMATVGNRIRETQELLVKQGVSCTLEWNEGNHFRDSDKRTAMGFAWLLNQSS